MSWKVKNNIVFVDVDGTLLIWPTNPGSPGRGPDGKINETPRVNQALVDALRKWRDNSFGQIVIWSRGGISHAQMAAGLCGFEGSMCISKPDCFVDDMKPSELLALMAYRSPDKFIEEMA